MVITCDVLHSVIGENLNNNALVNVGVTSTAQNYTDSMKLKKNIS